jgi:hypothetical protein
MDIYTITSLNTHVATVLPATALAIARTPHDVSNSNKASTILGSLSEAIF